MSPETNFQWKPSQTNGFHAHVQDKLLQSTLFSGASQAFHLSRGNRTECPNMRALAPRGGGILIIKGAVQVILYISVLVFWGLLFKTNTHTHTKQKQKQKTKKKQHQETQQNQQQKTYKNQTKTNIQIKKAQRNRKRAIIIKGFLKSCFLKQ